MGYFSELSIELDLGLIKNPTKIRGDYKGKDVFIKLNQIDSEERQMGAEYTYSGTIEIEGEEIKVLEIFEYPVGTLSSINIINKNLNFINEKDIDAFFIFGNDNIEEY